MNNYEKYIKYKSKYLNLLNELGTNNLINSNNSDNLSQSIVNLSDEKSNYNIEQNITGGSNKKSNLYICNPNKIQYKHTCTQNSNGQYKTKEQCENECDPKFISIQLKKANLHKESLQFYFFIQDLIKLEHANVYIKGGNVIGLAVLKMIYTTYSNDNAKFSKAFENFLKLELIQDWDFTAYTGEKMITDKYREKLDKIAEKQKLVPRAKTFILYQTKIPILIYDKALFEIAVLDSDSNEFSKMEIPMTTMKVRVDLSNIKYIFMMAKSFYSWKTKNIPIDLDIIKKIMSNIEIIIHPNKSGLYDPGKSLDAGELGKELVLFINNFASGNIFWTQFLITHMIDPYRLIYRLGEKNIKKTIKINNFIHKNIGKNTQPSWLLNVDKTVKLVDRFVESLGKKMELEYKRTGSFDKVLEFLTGANFGKPQLQIEWKDFEPETRTKIKKIFAPVIKQMGLDNFRSWLNTHNPNPKLKSSELTNTDKIIKFLVFLNGLDFFRIL
jgi:hypothetical protein